MKKATRQSVFMQMHNGTRTGEGSFNQALKELFYKAGDGNRWKLVDAFPEFFGEEVPEFGLFKSQRQKSGITQTIIGNGNIQIAGTTNKTFKYKGWECRWVKSEKMYYLYTPEELEQPVQLRYAECELETADMCKRFIDSY